MQAKQTYRRLTIQWQARVFAIFLLAFASAPAALANTACEAPYQEALAVPVEAHIDQGSRQKIESDIPNAWCMSGRYDTGTATLEITTAYMTDEGGSIPTGAGVHIRINGTTVTHSDENSRASVTVPADTVEIVGIVPSSAIGLLTITLEPGERRELTLLLDDSKEVVERTPLILDQLQDGVLPISFETFAMAFVNETGVLRVADIDFIDIEHPEGGMPVRIDQLFTLTDSGEMIANDLTTLRTLLQQQPHGKITIRAQGYDDQGFTHANTVELFLWR